MTGMIDVKIDIDKDTDVTFDYQVGREGPVELMLGHHVSMTGVLNVLPVGVVHV